MSRPTQEEVESALWRGEPGYGGRVDTLSREVIALRNDLEYERECKRSIEKLIRELADTAGVLS